MGSESSGSRTGIDREVQVTEDFIEIKVFCAACGASGLYRGYAESEGVAVVCLQCEGSGVRLLRFMRFKQRRLRDDVRVVRRPLSRSIPLGVGPDENSPEMTYEKFLQEIPATREWA